MVDVKSEQGRVVERMRTEGRRLGVVSVERAISAGRRAIGWLAAGNENQGYMRKVQGNLVI